VFCLRLPEPGERPAETAPGLNLPKALPEAAALAAFVHGPAQPAFEPRDRDQRRALVRPWSDGLNGHRYRFELGSFELDFRAVRYAHREAKEQGKQ
jgi:hypothetical protein